ncbi:MAG: hypothetical protein OEZ14_01550 [Acidimicrobiia bacterium]|nr:hypothetical protein [Acidimicrobiia bacterium]
MRFTKQFWDGISDGCVTVAFRLWKRPSVVVGRPYRTGGGRVEVVAVDIIKDADIVEADVIAAGYQTTADLEEYLDRYEDAGDRELYRIEFRLLDEPDPRRLLADDDDLDADQIAEIATRLDRLDRAAGHGPWTRQSLRLIQDHPAVRAPDLAAMVGRETKPFKLDVRKLKNLGLTESLRVGYRLSPRGRAYLTAIS